MESSLPKVVLSILIFIFLIPISQIATAQELSGGAKLVGTSPFVFAEGKLWIITLGVGVGPNLSDSAPTGYEDKPFNLSLTLKLYPIEIMNFSPYLGVSNRFSTRYIGSSYFGGIEFDFPSERLPLSAFGGGGIDYTTTEGFGGLGWHLGIKYKFSF